MSDFLGRLAARALGQAPPLGPRPASRFEGAPALSEEAVESALAETAPTGRALTSPALLSLRERREEEGRPEAGAGLEEARPVLSAERPPATSAPQGRHLNSLGLQPQVDDPQIFLNPEGVTSSPRPRPALPGLGGDDGLPALGLKPQAIQMPPLQGGDLPAATQEIEGISYFSSRAETHHPLIPRSALREESGLSGFGTPSPRSPQSPLAATGPGPAPAAAPVIRVTIGRIEVRAAAPAPAAPAARPAAPRLGLEEYLRRRGEGRT